MQEQVSHVDLSKIPSAELGRELGRRAESANASRRILKPCRHCKRELGVREMRNHLPLCTLNPGRRPRKKIDGEPR